MACYHPSKVEVLRKPIPALGPFRARYPVTVPCGHCLGCRADQARDWAIRMVHEADVHPPAWFVTLTYERCPELGSLDPRDPTLFLKRLRKTEQSRVSYFYCGEYGAQSDRPHYHAVLFGARFLDRDHLTLRHGAPVFTSDSLTAAWRHGICEITGLTYGGALYAAGYVSKKVRKAEYPEYYERVDPTTGEVVEVLQEFARMSRRPALGRRWIERYWRDVYPRDFVVVDGKEFKPPRYYDKWMDKEQPAVMMAVREQRYIDAVEIGDEKLIMKEKIHRARMRLYNRRDAV